MPYDDTAESDDAALRGRLFGMGQGGRGVDVEIIGDRLHTSVDGGDIEFPLLSCELSFGGTNNAMLLVERLEGDTKLSLYLPRVEAVAALKGLQLRAVTELVEHKEELDRGQRLRSVRNWLAVFAGLGAATWLCLAILDATLVWGIKRTPPSWEISLGELMMDSFHDEQERADGAEMRQAIDPIVVRLLEALGETDYNFEVHVVRNDVVNAFALPGGQIVVYSALIERCESPEELAGVLAHEVQHVLQRHSLVAIARQLKWSIMLSVILGDLDEVSALIIGQGAELVSLSNSREAESEADLEGAYLLLDAGIDPEGMMSFFEKLSEDDELSSSLEFLSSHPGSLNRVDAVRDAIADETWSEPSAFDIDWASLKQLIKESGTDEREDSR